MFDRVRSFYIEQKPGSRMTTLKGLARGIVFLVIGIAFLGLVAWEWRVGLAAGRFGGAAFAEAPGVGWFILAMQVAWGAGFLVAAEESFSGLVARDRRTPTYLQSVGTLLVIGFGCITAVLGIWAAFDMLAGAIGVLRDMGDDVASRIVLGFFLLASIGVFITLLITKLVEPFYLWLRPRLRVAIDHLSGRS